MSKKKITFTVTPDSHIDGYWIAVGNKDIKLNSGKGSISLTAGQRHILIWWMSGASGAKLKIIGKDTKGNEVVKKENSIPADEVNGGGVKRFKVN